MRHEIGSKRMTKWIKQLSASALSLLLLLALGTSGLAVTYPGIDKQPKPFMIKGSIVVQFEDNVAVGNLKSSFGRVSAAIPSLDAVFDRIHAERAMKIFPWRKQKPAANSGMTDLTRYYELRIPDTVDVMTAIGELLQNPNIRSAEPNWAYPLEATPNDPDYGSQWNMSPPGPDPHWYDAWDYEKGSDSIKLAMIDSGVKWAHPDLNANIWVNPGEDIDHDGVVYDTDDLNGVDDDGNGVVDDLIGYDFFSGFGGGTTPVPEEDGGTPDPNPDDYNGHGTNCAGIAAEVTNNGVGGAGAAGGWSGSGRWAGGCRIMCLRVGATATDNLGYVNSVNCATAIDYAAMMGANVISCSWGSSSVQLSAVNNAIAAGVTICHAAGNDNSDNPGFMDQLPGNPILSVAAVGPYSDNRASFSNYGTWVDVAAPGVAIYSTFSNDGAISYAALSGTSQATPGVAGLALLIRSAMPSLTKEQVDSIIVYSSDSASLYSVNPTWVGLLGHGRIDALAALSSLPDAKFSSDVTQGNIPLTVNFTDESPNSPTAWDWTFGDGGTSSLQNPSHTYISPGIYSVSLKEDEGNPLGWGEEHLKNYVWVTADTMQADSIEVNKGTSFYVPVRIHNTALVEQIQFAFTYNNSLGVAYDSVSAEGTRAGYFESVAINAADPFNKRFSVLMKTNTSGGSTYMTADTGVFLKIYFHVPSSAPDGMMTIDTATASGKSTKVTTIWGDYTPVFHVGKVVLSGCAHGDANCDGTIDVSDLIFLVEYSFGSGPAPDPSGGDVNGDGVVDISDVIYLVDYSFNNGPPPPSK